MMPYIRELLPRDVALFQGASCSDRRHSTKKSAENSRAPANIYHLPGLSGGDLQFQAGSVAKSGKETSR
jgi:hypothetical protein